MVSVQFEKTRIYSSRYFNFFYNFFHVQPELNMSPTFKLDVLSPSSLSLLSTTEFGADNSKVGVPSSFPSTPKFGVEILLSSLLFKSNEVSYLFISGTWLSLSPTFEPIW